MDRQKILITVLVVAVVLSGVATFSIWSFLRSKQQEVDRAKVELTEIVVAAENLPLGATVEERHLKMVRWPKGDVPAGSFTALDQLIGRIATSNLFIGEPLMEVKLDSAEGRAGVMAYSIPEGHRAMAVAVNDVAGVAGFIFPGSAVDVVVTTSRRGSATSRIILQKLRVLAIGQKMEDKGGKAVQVPTVTLSVTPAEAEKLALASNVGTLQLLLRGAKDADPTYTRGVSQYNLLRGRGRPAVARNTRAAPNRKKDEVNITVIKSGKAGTTKSQEKLVESGGFWKRSVVSK